MAIILGRNWFSNRTIFNGSMTAEPINFQPMLVVDSMKSDETGDTDSHWPTPPPPPPAPIPPPPPLGDGNCCTGFPFQSTLMKLLHAGKSFSSGSHFVFAKKKMNKELLFFCKIEVPAFFVSGPTPSNWCHRCKKIAIALDLSTTVVIRQLLWHCSHSNSVSYSRTHKW